MGHISTCDSTVFVAPWRSEREYLLLHGELDCEDCGMTSAERFESGVGRGDVLHRGIVSECVDGRTDTTLLKKGIPYPTMGK
jgi:hypothetical protein